MPTSLPSLTTGTCRNRRLVMTSIRASRVSVGAHVSTSPVMIAPTVLLTTVPSWWRWRTTSRSLTIPSTVSPSALTIRAPTLCSASWAMSSRTPASGVMVTTPGSALAFSTSAIFIATPGTVGDSTVASGRGAEQGIVSGLGIAGPARPQLGDRPGPGRLPVRVAVVVVQGSQERQNGVVQVAVGGQRVAAPWPVLTGQGREGAAGLTHDDVQRGHVVHRQLRLGGDVHGALGQQHVGPEVAVGPGPPAPPHQREEVV